MFTNRIWMYSNRLQVRAILDSLESFKHPLSFDDQANSGENKAVLSNLYNISKPTRIVKNRKEGKGWERYPFSSNSSAVSSVKKDGIGSATVDRGVEGRRRGSEEQIDMGIYIHIYQ
jgi:hypothetical protein